MSKHKENFNIGNFLFKPIIVRTELEERFIIIFSYNSITESILDDNGEVQKNHKDVIKFLDISKTTELGGAIIDSFVISDKKKFKESTIEIPAAQCFQDIIHIASVVTEEAQQLNERLIDTRNVIAAIRKASSSMKNVHSQGNLILAGSEQPLAHIVFKTVTGNKLDITKDLSREDIGTLGEILLDIIHKYMDDDLENPELIKKLKAEIEYRIVDSLPMTLKAGDVNINLEAFVEEIKRFRENNREESE